MKKSTKSAKKTAAPKKGHATQTVTLKKTAKESDLPPQAAGILVALRAKGGKLAVADLTRAMEGKIKTKQSLSVIWGFYRARLIKEGYVSVAAGKGGAQ